MTDEPWRGNNLVVRGVYLADWPRDRFLRNGLITVGGGTTTRKRGANVGTKCLIC